MLFLDQQFNSLFHHENVNCQINKLNIMNWLIRFILLANINLCFVTNKFSYLLRNRIGWIARMFIRLKSVNVRVECMAKHHFLQMRKLPFLFWVSVSRSTHSKAREAKFNKCYDKLTLSLVLSIKAFYSFQSKRISNSRKNPFTAQHLTENIFRVRISIRT